MEVIKAKLNKVKAFLYTTQKDHKYLIVDQNLRSKEIKHYKEKSKDKESYLFTN